MNRRTFIGICGALAITPKESFADYLHAPILPDEFAHADGTFTSDRVFGAAEIVACGWEGHQEDGSGTFAIQMYRHPSIYGDVILRMNVNKTCGLLVYSKKNLAIKSTAGGFVAMMTIPQTSGAWLRYRRLEPAPQKRDVAEIIRQWRASGHPYALLEK